jgi:hypothetical protein
VSSNRRSYAATAARFSATEWRTARDVGLGRDTRGHATVAYAYAAGLLDRRKRQRPGETGAWEYRRTAHSGH